MDGVKIYMRVAFDRDRDDMLDEQDLAGFVSVQRVRAASVRPQRRERDLTRRTLLKKKLMICGAFEKIDMNERIKTFCALVRWVTPSVLLKA